jgi:hypothetical protein
MSVLKTIIVIIGFAVAIAISVLLKRASRAANRALNQKVFQSGTYAKQQELTGHSWRFYTSANASQIMAAIEEFANKYQSNIGDKYRIRVIERTDTKMILTYGIEGRPAFTASLVFENSNGNPYGEFKVLNWLTAEGVAPSANVMEHLLHASKDAFMNIDGATQIEKRENKNKK